MANLDCPHPEIRNNQCLACGADTSTEHADWVQYYIDDGFPTQLAEEFADVEMRSK
jgi:hypothetical protein